MPYSYGLQGSPAVGKGLGGLPNRKQATFTNVAIKGAAGAGQLVYSTSLGQGFSAAQLVQSATGPDAIMLSGHHLAYVETIGKTATPYSSVSTAPDGSVLAVAQTSPNFFANAAGIKKDVSLPSAGLNGFESVSFSKDGTFAIGFSNTLAVYSNNGNLVFSVTAPIANTSPTTVASGPNQRYAILSRLGANNALYISIYNFAGVQQGSTITLAGQTRGKVAYNNSATNNGDYVAAMWNSSAARQPIFQRFNSSGVQQGATTTVEAVAQSSLNSPGVAYGPNGDFVISYVDTTNTSVKFARYNANGAIQGAITVVASVAAVNSSVAFSENGEFVIAYVTSNGELRFQKYTAGGATLGGNVLVDVVGTNFTANDSADQLVAYSTNGELWFSYVNTSNFHMVARYTYDLPSANYFIAGLADENVSSSTIYNLRTITNGGGINAIANFSSVGGSKIRLEAFK